MRVRTSFLIEKVPHVETLREEEHEEVELLGNVEHVEVDKSFMVIQICEQLRGSFGDIADHAEVMEAHQPGRCPVEYDGTRLKQLVNRACDRRDVMKRD